MQKKWMLRVTSLDIDKVSKQAGIPKVIAKILANRDIRDAEKIKEFMESSVDYVNDPFLMADMDLGTDLILDAIEDEKKIVVYGDYDADGVTSTVILYKALKEIGANVSYYIPDRENEGYGMCKERIKKLKEEGMEVIITCDNGISAIEEIKYAKELGFTVVMTDHHELPFSDEKSKEHIMPQADAVINIKREDCNYPFKSLCGAGIALKFVQALFLKIGYEDEKFLKYIEFAGIGTICDVVDLKEENRIIVKEALKNINNTTNIGLKELKEAVGYKDKKVNSYCIGFVIGPCINATGRLETANMAVELFTTKDSKKAKELAKELVELNKKRQEMTNDNVDEIIKYIEASDLKKDKVLVVYNEKVHESIAGIVAGRIKEKYNVPTFILTKGKEFCKGSGRSIEEYNMFEEMSKCKSLLEKFGGHPMAAGLSIKEENIELFREKLNEECSLKEEDLIPKIRIDVALHVNQLSFPLIDKIHELEPFGKGNSSPLFADKGVIVNSAMILGKDKNVLKFQCKNEGGNRYLQAICFNRVSEFQEFIKEKFGEKYGSEINVKNYTYVNIPENMKLDFIYIPDINEFNGNKNIQMRVVDFR